MTRFTRDSVSSVSSYLTLMDLLAPDDEEELET